MDFMSNLFRTRTFVLIGQVKQKSKHWNLKLYTTHLTGPTLKLCDFLLHHPSASFWTSLEVLQTNKIVQKKQPIKLVESWHYLPHKQHLSIPKQISQKCVFFTSALNLLLTSRIQWDFTISIIQQLEKCKQILSWSCKKFLAQPLPTNWWSLPKTTAKVLLRKTLSPKLPPKTVFKDRPS